MSPGPVRLTALGNIGTAVAENDHGQGVSALTRFLALAAVLTLGRDGADAQGVALAAPQCAGSTRQRHGSQ